MQQPHLPLAHQSYASSWRVAANCTCCKVLKHCLEAGAAAAPAYAADTAAGRRVWRLLTPRGGPPAACPPGTGEGEFQPLGKPCTVVGALS